MKTIVLLFLVLVLPEAVECTVLTNYFNFKVGNIYIYSIKREGIGGTSYFTGKYRITKDTTVNGKQYFYHQLYLDYIRFDTTNFNLYVYKPGFTCNNAVNEQILDSLNINLGGSSNSCQSGTTKNCVVKGDTIFYNQVYESIGFNSQILPNNVILKYLKGLGLIHFEVGGGGHFDTFDLKACKIDNVNYGDSSYFYLLNVSTISSETPNKFSLSQNYPNPFNPSTKINYEIKLAGFVSLKVFDLLGKEVATLVNEKQNAGSYAVDFNTTEFNLPSGIYFYTLNAGEFKETRKMMLVK